MKRRRTPPGGQPRIDSGDASDSVAQPVKTETNGVTDEAKDRAKAAEDQSREVARQAYEKIKAARKRSAERGD